MRHSFHKQNCQSLLTHFRRHLFAARNHRRCRRKRIVLAPGPAATTPSTPIQWQRWPAMREASKYAKGGQRYFQLDSDALPRHQLPQSSDAGRNLHEQSSSSLRFRMNRRRLRFSVVFEQYCLANKTLAFAQGGHCRLRSWSLSGRHCRPANNSAARLRPPPQPADCAAGRQP